jgi:Flp pilus assembly pilin Flp
MLKLFALADLFKSEEGQTMTEYAVTLGVITVAVIGVIGLLSTSIVNIIGRVASAITGLAP